MTFSIALKPVRLWRAYPRETIVLTTLGLALAGALAGVAYSIPVMPPAAGDPARVTLAPPAPPPLLVRQLAPEDAVAINRGIPLADGPNPAARPFSLGKADAAARARATECLTSAVYYEAGNESADGQKAVAQVVLNRVRHPAFPANVCGVVYQGSTRTTGCQFTFTCDGSLMRRPAAAGWARARKVAEAALAGAVHAPVGTATHYHANYVVPYWASSLVKNAISGAHIFYRWSGGWGRPPAFAQRYAQAEPDSAALRAAAALAGSKDEAEAIAEIPGAEALAEADTDNERIAIRFNLAARKAVEEAPRQPYVDKVAASQNLRWSLSGGTASAHEQPLGRAAPSYSVGDAGGASDK